MKLVILGIDALDINMIKKLDLNELKQAQYGELKVPLSSISGYPRSPSVWATFLTGKEKEIDFTRNREGINSFVGLEDDEVFTDWDGVKGINVPFRNHELDTLTKLVRLRKKLRWRRGIIRDMVDIHLTKTRQIFNEVINTHKSYKVIFAFVQTLDTLEHALFLRPKAIKNVYREMEIDFKELKQEFLEDMIIIVSDHGFEKDTHSFTGFYSCNHVLSPIPNNIIDFYGIVKDFLRDGKTT